MKQPGVGCCLTSQSSCCHGDASSAPRDRVSCMMLLALMPMLLALMRHAQFSCCHGDTGSAPPDREQQHSHHWQRCLKWWSSLFTVAGSVDIGKGLAASPPKMRLRFCSQRTPARQQSPPPPGVWYDYSVRQPAPPSRSRNSHLLKQQVRTSRTWRFVQRAANLQHWQPSTDRVVLFLEAAYSRSRASLRLSSLPMARFAQGGIICL